MIRRRSNSTETAEAQSGPQSFDDFAVKLGDMMRGERATLGKSLLDVQRELRIKASYIAAIENCDPSAFDTPGFIAGYVRSYARYLGLDPDETFALFCAESGFSTAHGMSDKASSIRKAGVEDMPRPRARDPLAEPNLPFAVARDSVFSRIEPAAIGSSLVLLALIGGIGFGGWTVLQEIQRVQVAPVEQTPVVLSELDPLDAARTPSSDTPAQDNAVAGLFTPPSSEAFDRLYRPEALDVPVLVSRDAPISTLDPESVGVFADARRNALPATQDSSLAAAALAEGLIDRPTIALAQSGVSVVAARPAWVEITDAQGTVLRSGVLNAGEIVAVPQGGEGAKIHVGESGAVYFAVNGDMFGPAGPRGQVTRNIDLSPQTLAGLYSTIDPAEDTDLMAALGQQDSPAATRVADAAPVLGQPPAIDTPSFAALGQPQVTVNPEPGITVVATAETWVEVTAPSGKKLFAQVLQAGQTYQVPQTEKPATIFSGNAGGVYFAVNGQTFGPYGNSGQFGRGLELSHADITTKMAVADLSQNQTLAKVVAELNLRQSAQD